MENYYGILQVEQNAGKEEIKKAFRTLAKKYHPDKNRDEQEWAEKKTKNIIKAYNTLTDVKLREYYDIQLANTRTTTTTTIKQSVRKANGNKISFQVKMILNDLVNNFGKKAIEDFEYLKKHTNGFALHKYLTGRDYFDCMFLLGEEYEKLGKYNVAVTYYKKIYEKVKRKTKDNNYSFFFDETRNRIKKIYCKKLAKNTSTSEAVNYYQSVLTLHINNNERAYIYKKISECYFEMEEYHNAVANLNTALNIKPTLKGINKIQTRLNEHFASLTVN
ncbi:MAG: DnaJ domain-containing protein [Candidatus Anammoxibacter sp.]